MFDPAPGGRLYPLNPLTKLSVSLAFILLAFLLPSPLVSLGLFCLAIFPLSLWGGIALPMLNACLRLAAPAAGVLFFVQGLFYPGGQTAALRAGPLVFWQEGLAYAGLISARLLVMVSSFSILLGTTPPAKLTMALQQAGLPASFAYVLAAALQLLPEARQRALAILRAQRARGLRVSGSLPARARAVLPLVVPMISSTLVMAEERAAALELRAFRSGVKPTTYYEIEDAGVERAVRWLCGLLVLAAGIYRLWP